MTIPTRHLTIERRARYAVLEGDPERTREVWFVLHGYGQLAHRFVRSFHPLDDGSRRIVSAEGLHRYYLDHAARKVGASWMTSEDRLTDIEDYVAYLDRLREHEVALSGLVPGDTRVVALGFSQGVHTLCRWLAFGSGRVDAAVLWGGTVPPDLDLAAHGDGLRRVELHLAMGSGDEYFGAEAIRAHEARLAAAGIPFRSWSFEGGHRIDAVTLRSIAAAIREPRDREPRRP